LERTVAAAAVVVFTLELLVMEVVVVREMAVTVFQFLPPLPQIVEVAAAVVEIQRVAVVHLMAAMADLELSLSAFLLPKHQLLHQYNTALYPSTEAVILQSPLPTILSCQESQDRMVVLHLSLLIILLRVL